MSNSKMKPVYIAKQRFKDPFGSNEAALKDKVIHELAIQMLQLEEQLIKDVLKQLLNREATVEDFKKTSKVIDTAAFPKEYLLVYDNQVLGTVKYEHIGYDFNQPIRIDQTFELPTLSFTPIV